ncbi:MAG: TolC family protein [Chitinophagales bacterium]|nr:TolC family protein [Chitinophagales bacterium]
MKNLFPALLILMAFYAQAQQAGRLSLQQAIDYAMEHQPAFQNYKADQRIAQARSLEATSKYLPKVNGSYDMRNNLKLGQIALKFPNPVTGIEEDRTIQQGTKYSATAGVDLQQPLLDMSAVSDIQTASKQQELANLQLQQATIDLKLNVSRAYYLALLNQERVNKVSKSVERFEKAYNDTKVRFDNGNALKSEVNRAYLNLSNAKFQLKTATDSIETSKTYLLQLIGMEPDARITLTDALPVNVSVVALPEYPDVKGAELSRVELKAENVQETLNRQQQKKITYQYIPTINGYGYIGGQGIDNKELFRRESWFWTSYIGLRVNIPIFDGLQKMALSQQQKLTVSKNQNNIAAIKSTIRYQLQTTSFNYSNAAQNLLLIKENVQLAEDLVKDVNVRYANAVATYQEVLDAENTLKETEFNYLQALYAYLISELEWKKANGKL